jgi:hypothetical protein
LATHLLPARRLRMRRRYFESGLSRVGKSVRIDNGGVSRWTPNHLVEARRAHQVRDYDLGIVCLYAGDDVIDRQVPSYGPRKKAGRNSFEFPPSLEWIEIVYAVLLPMNVFWNHSLICTRCSRRDCDLIFFLLCKSKLSSSGFLCGRIHPVGNDCEHLSEHCERVH